MLRKPLEEDDTLYQRLVHFILSNLVSLKECWLHTSNTTKSTQQRYEMNTKQIQILNVSLD